MPQSPAFRQVVIPPDQLDQMAHLQADDGWPLHWEIIPELPLAELQVSHAALTRDLGISFDQRIDLEDGLGNRPRAILVLPSGFRVALLLYPIESPEYDRYVMVEADPTSVNRPFVAGPFGEYILERYQTELIDEVLAALQLPTTCVEWRQRPFFDPPLSTEEGLRAFAQHYAAVPPPHYPVGSPVHLRPQRPALAALDGEPGTVLRHWITGRRQPDAEPDDSTLQWRYEVAVPSKARFWRLWEDEIRGHDDPTFPEGTP